MINIQIPNNLLKSQIFKDMKTLMDEYPQEDININVTEFLNDVVYEFIKSTSNYDEVEIQYLSRVFYAYKGTTEVLDLITANLNMDIEYTYVPEALDIVIKEVRTKDPMGFVNTFTKFLVTLLYFEDLTTLVEKITFLIESELDPLNTSVKTVNYKFSTLNIIS